MTAADKIQKAKVQLIVSQPFFATLVLSMGVIADATVKDMSTDGETIKYNPEYIDKQSIDEILSLMCHEVLHVTNLHHTRREGRDAAQWNKAADYAINPILEECGFKLPKGALIDRKYKDMYTEKIFSLLPAPKPDEKQQPGEVKDTPAKSESERQEKEAQIKQRIVQAAANAKKAGKLTESIKRLLEEVLSPVINWKEVLNRFICETARNDYSFKKPNPRFIQSGFYLPSLHNEEPGKIVLIVDTSASIDDELLKQFSAELQDACNTIGHTLTVIYVDTKVQGVEEIEPDDNVKLNPIGGGGTDFKPGFNYIDENRIDLKAVVYFTDGMCNSYPETPDFPVLWAQYGEYDFNPPFGEVIYFN